MRWSRRRHARARRLLRDWHVQFLRAAAKTDWMTTRRLEAAVPLAAFHRAVYLENLIFEGHLTRGMRRRLREYDDRLNGAARSA